MGITITDLHTFNEFGGKVSGTPSTRPAFKGRRVTAEIKLTCYTSPLSDPGSEELKKMEFNMV